jgi:hypothetical protein
MLAGLVFSAMPVGRLSGANLPGFLILVFVVFVFVFVVVPALVRIPDPPLRLLIVIVVVGKRIGTLREDIGDAARRPQRGCERAGEPFNRGHFGGMRNSWPG